MDEHHRLLDRLVDQDEPDVGNVDEIDGLHHFFLSRLFRMRSPMVIILTMNGNAPASCISLDCSTC
jgi:hypothetical protein